MHRAKLFCSNVWVSLCRLAIAFALILYLCHSLLKAKFTSATHIRFSPSLQIETSQVPYSIFIGTQITLNCFGKIRPVQTMCIYRVCDDSQSRPTATQRQIYMNMTNNTPNISKTPNKSIGKKPYGGFNLQKFGATLLAILQFVSWGCDWFLCWRSLSHR